MKVSGYGVNGIKLKVIIRGYWDKIVVKEDGNFCLTSTQPGVILSKCAFLRINL